MTNLSIARATRPGLVLLFLALATPVAAQGDVSILTLLDTDSRRIAVGGEVSGELSEQDYLAAGRRVQAWAVEAEAGSALQIDMVSDDLDTYLYLAGPGLGELSDDDGGDGVNARLCVEFPESATYHVVASSFGGDVGPYRILAMDRASCEDSFSGRAEITDLSTLDTGDRTVPWDGEATGALSGADPTSFGSAVQAWAIQGRAGETLTLDLVSDAFDAYLTVLGPGLGEWLTNDDGAGRCDSRIAVTFPEDGAFRAIVSAVSGGTGAFTLTSYVDPPAPNPGACIPPMAAEPSTGPSTPIEELPARGEVEVGSSVTGNLTGEAQYENRPAERWTLEAEAGQQLAIDQTSDLIDSYLYLRGPGFERPEYNDDVDGSFNSRICVTVPETGTYDIVSAGFGSDDTGPYRLAVTQDADGVICDNFLVSLQAGFAGIPLEGQALEPGVEIEGSLDPMVDERHPIDQSLIDVYAMEADAGELLVVDLVSDEFDSFMYLSGPGLADPIVDDDGGGRCHSRIELVAPQAGTYRVVVNSLSDAGYGAYTLRVAREAGPVAEGSCMPSTPDATAITAIPSGSLDHVQPAPGRELAVGTEVSGELTADDPVIEDGKYAQAWSLQAREGQVVVVEVLSEDLDTYLYLTGPDFAGALTDDDGGPGTNSRVTFTAQTTGTYRVVVSTFGSESVGTFRLRALRSVGGGQ